MRWWMAALLAIICIAIGMLLPLPTMEYQGAFVPTEATAPPLVNIGLAGDSTPRPLATPLPAEPQPEEETLSLTYAPGLTAGFGDFLAEARYFVPVEEQGSYNEPRIDIENLRWYQYEGTRASRVGSRLTLVYDMSSIRIQDVETGALLYEKPMEELCADPYRIAWDLDAFGNIAVCVTDSVGYATTLLYESATGDDTIFENFCDPKFSPDGASLYMIERMDEQSPALYRVTPPSGQPARVTADTVNVYAHQPVALGVVVRGEDLEAGRAFLVQLDEDGGELYDFDISNPLEDGVDRLFPVDGGHAYMTARRDGVEYALLLDLLNRRRTELEPGVIPVALSGDTLLLKNGEAYHTIHQVSGERIDLILER